MAQDVRDLGPGDSGLISLQDVLHSFNNSINEEQAWAVCYMCADYFVSNHNQDKFRDIYYYGAVAIRIQKDGDVVIESTSSQGSGKGSPRKRSSFSSMRDFKTAVTQIDAIQALGSAIYKALDFGLSESEEPHLSSDLEEVIEYMTHPGDDDEGIDVERDADDSQGKDQCIWKDIIDYCVHHLSSGQEAGHHYKAVCRALVTETKELVTFLDNIASGHERLVKDGVSNTDSLDDLQRSDWARLWVQIMRDLRRGVRLKKVEQVHLTPAEFELTPFEILLEDIRLGRFKLNRIMVNGDIAPTVKSDAHAVILDFIRSRPPLKPAKQRVLSSRVVKLDFREKLMLDIQKPQSLRPVRAGKLVVKSPRTVLPGSTEMDDDDEDDSPKVVRKVIKPVAAFEVNSPDGKVSDSDDSYMSDDSVGEGRRHLMAPSFSLSSPLSPTSDSASWKRAVARDLINHPANHHKGQGHSLHRRHTISEYQIKKQVSSLPQQLSVYEEDENVKDEDNPNDAFVREHASKKTTKFVSYRNRPAGHRVVHDQDSESNCTSPVNVRHASHHRVVNHSHSNLEHGRSVSSSCLHEPRSRKSCLHASQSPREPRSKTPCQNVSVPLSVSSQCKHAPARSGSPVKRLTRSETFSTSTSHTRAQNSDRSEVFIARSDSPCNLVARSDSFPPPRCSSPQTRSTSPGRHVSHKVLYSSHDSSSPHVCDSSETRCRNRPVSERCDSPSSSTSARSHSKSPPNRHVSQSEHRKLLETQSKRLSLQVQRSQPEHEQDHHHGDSNTTSSTSESVPVPRPRRTIVRAKSHHEIRPSSLSVKSSTNCDKENSTEGADKLGYIQQQASKFGEVVSRRSRLPRTMSSRASSSSSSVIDRSESQDSTVGESVPNNSNASKPLRREVRLTRQSAIRTARPEVNSVPKSVSSDNDSEPKSATTEPREPASTSEPVMARHMRTVRHKSHRVRSPPEEGKGQGHESQQVLTNRESLSTDPVRRVPARPRRENIEHGERSVRKDVCIAESDSKDTEKKLDLKPVRPIMRSRSEVRPRSELRPVRADHSPEFRSSIHASEISRPKPVFGSQVKVNFHSPEAQRRALPEAASTGVENKEESGWSLGSAIKQGLSQLNVSDLLHHKWQNPIQCLSLTLEEVTHIRMVLTKAELESLISDTELYTNISKGKVCFTCKKTKFSLFGQWSTKCKFCQRCVCNYCLRKVNVPTEHFEKIPVYTLSPVPISPEVLEALKVYESTGSVPHSPVQQRKAVTRAESPAPAPPTPSPTTDDDNRATKRRTLQRSHTIGVGSRPPPNKALLKGPQMSICCDCKTMIMEIIRASRTSVALVNKGTEKQTQSPEEKPKERPRSMLDHFNFKSFNFQRNDSQA